MKSWILTGPETFVFDEQESAPLSGSHLAKVKVDAAVIDATDIRLYTNKTDGNPYPIVPGRQGAGVVSEVFENNDCFLEKGNRVVVDPFLPCGNCLFCKTNRDYLCPNAKVLGLTTNGLYTNFITLDCNMLHRIPDNMSNQTALFTEYVAMALSVIDRIRLKEGDHVAVFGANKLGFIVAQLAAYYQGIPIVLDSNDNQLENLTKEKVEFVINPEKSDFKQNIKEITGGRNCEKVVYISNNATTVNDALGCCSHSGVFCLAGPTSIRQTGSFEEIHRKQLTVVATANGHKNFPSAINMLATKTVRIASLLGDKINFNDIPEEFAKRDLEKIRYCSTEIIID